MGQKRESRVSLLCGGLSLVLVLCASAAAHAEIYRWTDASGRVHFTQDLGQVPARQRAAAEAAAKQPRKDPIQRIQVPASPLASASKSRSRAAGIEGAGEKYRIRVERAGNAMRVNVLVNGELEVPFHIDTGATDVVLPKWAADELKLDLSEARTGVYGTANGTITQQLTTLESVSLGGARVDRVPASVSPSMPFGLLGLSYFNHFRYDIDPVAGVVTLERNGLAEQGVLRAGRSREQWRAQFAMLHRRIEHAEQRRDEVPFAKTRKRAELDARVQELERQLEVLNDEADEARVPFGWRD